MKLKDLLHSQFLEGGGTIPHTRGQMGGQMEPGNWLNQAGGEPRERLRTPRQALLLGVKGEYTDKRRKGISLMHWNVIRSQEKARKGIHIGY